MSKLLPPLLPRRTPAPGLRVLCVLATVDQVWRAGLPGVFWCASPFLWPCCPPALLGQLQAGVALFLSFCLPAFFSLFFCFAPPLSLAFCCFGPWAPLALAPRVFFCPPPDCTFLFAPALSSAFSGFWPRGVSGPWRCAVPPPPLHFFLSVCGFLPTPPPALVFVLWPFSPCCSAVLVLPLLFCFLTGLIPLPGGRPFSPPGVCFADVVVLPLVVPCCSFAVLLLPACLAFVGGSRLAPAPPPGERVVPCAACCRRAVLDFPLVFCGVVLPCSVLPVVLCCPALLCCWVPRAVGCSFKGVFVCCAVLCRAVDCCCVFCCVSGHVVPLQCLHCGLLFCFGLCCRWLRLVPGSLAAALSCALFRLALCCCALCCFVTL